MSFSQNSQFIKTADHQLEVLVIEQLAEVDHL
jgi:hypothetical protein